MKLSDKTILITAATLGIGAAAQARAQSEGTASILNMASTASSEKDFIARQPMGRLSTVDDLTPMIVLLLSSDGQFMTGQSVLVDGGCTI